MPTLFLHGTPRLAGSGNGDLRLSAREAALLAWLHLEGPAPRSRLAGLLWPAGSEPQARANLRQTLARLRRAAGAVLAESAGVLRVADGIDVADPEGLPLLGPLEYDDSPEFAEWLMARRGEAARRFQRERLAAARAALDRADLEQALAGADAVLAMQPESEEAWRLRMEVLHRRGDRASALQAWDDCQHALRAAFGVTPSAETQALGRRILSDGTAPALPGLPASLREPPPLIGRDELLAQMQRVLAMGHGVVVLGPGGIGKSRLMAELARRWEPALSVGARMGDVLRPGALLARLVGAALRRFDPVLDDVTRADVQRMLPARSGGGASHDLRSTLEHRRVLASVSCLLSASAVRGLRVVVIDDLHFADDESLEALQVVIGHWARSSSPPTVLPLLGARSDELGARAIALIEQLVACGRGARFELPPLTREQLQLMLGGLELPGAPTLDLARLAAGLHAQLGGNPAFVLESLKCLWLDGPGSWTPEHPLPVPPTLIESVRRRLGSLSPQALQLAQLAALAQGDFSLALAARALGCEALALAPQLSELESAQVLVGLAFAHDLVAEAVARSVPAALRPTLHRLVAQHLQAEGAPAAGIAHHLAAAGDTRAAVPWHLQAAQQARSHWQMAEAAAAFEAAARSMDPESERAQALAAWVNALRCRLVADQVDEVPSAIEAARPLVRSEGDQALLATAHTVWLFNTGQRDQVGAAATELTGLIERSVASLAPGDLAYGLRIVCASVPHGMDAARAMALARRVEAMLDPADADAWAILRTARGAVLHWMSGSLEAATDLDEAWQAACSASDPGPKIMVGNQLMRVRHALGDLAGAIAVGEAVLPVAVRCEVRVGLQTDVMHVLAVMQVSSGQAAAGLARFADLQARLHAAGETVPATYLAALSAVYIAVGRPAAAALPLGQHPAPGQPGFAQRDRMLFLTQARLAVAHGESPAPWLARIRGLSADPMPKGPALQLQVALALLDPDGPEAVDLPIATLRERGLLGMLRSALIAAARAALRAGAIETAVAHAHGALAIAQCVDGWIDEPASVWATAFEVFDAAGERAAARAVLARGRAWVEQGSAQWHDAGDLRAWRLGNPLHRALLDARSDV